MVVSPIEKHFAVASPYQYYAWCLLMFSKLPISWHLVSLVFLSPPVDFQCGDKGNNTCPCDDVKWDLSYFTNTVPIKYSLHCERSWWVTLSECLYYGGFLVGAFFGGFCSDRFGRLVSFCLSCQLVSIIGILVVFMPSIQLYVIMRFLNGIGVGSAIITGYVIVIEYCGAHHREIVTVLYHLPITLGHVTTAAISYALRDFEHYQLAISVPVLLCALFYFFLHESPKWLFDNNNIEKASVVMMKICKFNKKPCDDIMEEMIAYRENQIPESEKKLYFWHLFKHFKLTLNFLFMACNYFVCGMGYYGVSQFISKMSGNIHYNVIITGLLLNPGTIFSIYLLKKLSRRVFLLSTNFLSGLTMIIVIFVPSSLVWVRVVIASICCTCFFMSFIVVFLYGVELFPTAIRSSVLGLLSAVSRVGQILGPFVNQLSETKSGLVYALLVFTAGGLCFFLPETKNTELPATIEQTKLFTRHGPVSSIAATS